MNLGFLRRWTVAPVLGLIWLYKKIISPMLPPSCIYYPTCSEYAHQALVRHGLFKGSVLAVWRLLRCQPFCQGGVDDVPLKFTFLKS